MAFSRKEHQHVMEDLDTLFDKVAHLKGWHKDHTRQFIDVGEYAPAMDGIANAYLINNANMPPDLSDTFGKLANMVQLETDLEYQAVAELRARQRPDSRRPIPTDSD